MNLNEVLKTTIRNVVTILALDLIALPVGIFLYLTHGFHIVHVVLGVSYLYGVLLVYSTATLLYKNVKIVSAQEETETSEDELDYDDFQEEDEDYSDEPIKPEMKKAMDEVFDLKKH